MRTRSMSGLSAILVPLCLAGALAGAPAWADVADDTAPPADGGDDGGDEEDDDDGCGSDATSGASLVLGGLLLMGLRRRAD